MYALILAAAFGGPDTPAVDKFDLIGQLADHEKRLAVIEKRLGIGGIEIGNDPVTVVVPFPTRGATLPAATYAAPVAMDCSSGVCRPVGASSRGVRRGLFGRRWR